MDLSVVISFGAFLLVFLAIGVYSVTRARESTADYLVASRSIHPVAMALSAVATNNSGFMFVGLIGETFTSGVSSMWIMVGWVAGDYLAWVLGVPRLLRERSERAGSVTIPGFLGQGLPGGGAVRVVAALITLAFLGTYAAAQLTAGGKALQALFTWPYAIGVVAGAGIVVAYCFAGGIRASIWTDVAQSLVMMAAMLLLCLLGARAAGGPAALWEGLRAQDPALVAVIPGGLRFGFAPFMLGWLMAGLGVVGQPHIMIRAMTLDSPESIPTARRVYVLWNALFAAAAIGVGLAARALLSPGALPDPELAMPLLSLKLLPGPLVGLVLAGLFAATMSTADSQVLACSAAISQDILGRDQDYRAAKVATLVVALLVLLVALARGSVFGLVVLSWSALAAGLGPLLVLRAFGVSVPGPAAIVTMLAGLGGVLAWRFGLGLSGAIYDVLPGMATGLAVYLILRAAGLAAPAPGD